MKFNHALLSFLFVPFVANAQEAKNLVTFEDAFRAAIDKTEVMPIAESRVRQSEGVVSEARSNLLPDLSLNAQYTRYDEPTPTAITTNRIEQRTVKMTLLQSLFNKQYYSNLSSSKASRDAERFRLSDTRLILYGEVARRFYDVQIFESDVRNLSATIELNNSRIKDLSGRTRIGRSREGDLLTAQSQLAVLQANLQVAKGELSIARGNFAQVTGLPSESQLVEVPKELPTLQPLDSYLKAIEERPDIKALNEDVRAARENVFAAKAGHWPTLGFTGNYYLDQDSTSGIDWDLTVGLTLPLYSGGEVLAQTRQAIEQEVQSELALRRERRDAETTIRNAYVLATSSVEQVRALSNALAATERNYRTQNRDYRLSLVTNLDVVQALNAFHETKRAYDRAVISASSAFAQLQAATATLPSNLD